MREILHGCSYIALVLIIKSIEINASKSPKLLQLNGVTLKKKTISKFSKISNFVFFNDYK